MAPTNDRTSEDASGRFGGRAHDRASDRKEAQRAESVRHTIEMHDRFAPEIERSAKGARFYDRIPEGAGALAGRVPKVEVVDEDSVSAVLQRGRGLAKACDLAVLDFASFTHPGGGYDRGTMAQEESLCAESFLYNVLKGFGGWYADNRRRNINCELYRDRAIMVPQVRFEREKYHSYADVIVAAAPNLRRARADYHVDDEVARRALEGRIRLVLGIADVLGRQKLVLGAFGCGVFGWDAAVVAEAFRAELASGLHVASEVVFAVPSSRRDSNLAYFEHAFAAFPEANPAPFSPRLFEPERAPKPKDDGPEDDWRQYL